jgi:uncharacterized tellurite resistance protein B-like protein
MGVGPVFIRKLLGLPGADEPARDRDTETVRRIVRELGAMEPERARYLAAFAFILSRGAHADLHVSPEETRAMEDAVALWGGLSAAQAVLVVQIAQSQSSLFGATQDFVVTRQFGTMSTPAQREELLHCLFAVSAADDSISSAEESVLRQIATELGLSDRDFLAIRSTYNHKRAVMKGLPGGA